MKFNQGVEILQEYREIPNEEELKFIPQFYRADVDFVYRLGGKFLRDWVTSLPLNDFKYVSIDARLSMLMPGWYPSIDGWHCDDFYRPDNDQPDLENVMKKAPANHYMTLIGDASLTEFLEPCNLFNYKTENVYSKFDETINGLLHLKAIRKYSVNPNQLIKFTPLDFHRASPATKRGWRLFIRATESNHRVPKNEIRTQSQVYLSLGKGW